MYACSGLVYILARHPTQSLRLICLSYTQPSPLRSTLTLCLEPEQLLHGHLPSPSGLALMPPCGDTYGHNTASLASSRAHSRPTYQPRISSTDIRNLGFRPSPRMQHDVRTMHMRDTAALREVDGWRFFVLYCTDELAMA